MPSSLVDLSAVTKRQKDFERFVNRTETCWLWIGGKNPGGYGTFRVGHVRRGAHCWAWEWANGPIPDGMQIHHKCHIRSCVNPAHLAAVTRRQNLQHRKYESWTEIDGRIDGEDAEPLTVTLSPKHSAWVRQRAADSGLSHDEIVGLALYRYMARWIGNWAQPTLSTAAE